MDELPPEALKDCFRPPGQPVEVHCLHCGRDYDSYLMEWRENEDRRSDSTIAGFWCCPTPGCGGVGFLFDIYPTDPDWIDPETGEKVWQDDPPMIEGHESDCECVECEMACEEQEAEFEREAIEYERKLASGEIKPPSPQQETRRTPIDENDIPF